MRHRLSTIRFPVSDRTVFSLVFQMHLILSALALANILLGVSAAPAHHSFWWYNPCGLPNKRPVRHVVATMINRVYWHFKTDVTPYIDDLKVT